MNYYVLFPNHTEGLKLEQKMKLNNIKYEVAPTPRALSVSCGISLKIMQSDIDKIEKLIEDYNISTLGIKSIDKSKTRKFF